MLTILASEKLGREGMVEWNRILWLFLFSGILGQAREVNPKFRNEIPENVLSIHSLPGISRIFGRMESALCVLTQSNSESNSNNCQQSYLAST